MSGERRTAFLEKVSEVWLFFFFQAEDGIRDLTVTGVQTCALQICAPRTRPCPARRGGCVRRATVRPARRRPAPAGRPGAHRRCAAPAAGAHTAARWYASPRAYRGGERFARAGRRPARRGARRGRGGRRRPPWRGPAGVVRTP